MANYGSKEDARRGPEIANDVVDHEQDEMIVPAAAPDHHAMKRAGLQVERPSRLVAHQPGDPFLGAVQSLLESYTGGGCFQDAEDGAPLMQGEGRAEPLVTLDQEDPGRRAKEGLSGRASDRTLAAPAML